MQFNEAWDIVAIWEGGYVNDPQDPGGETKYGITKRDFPNVDIKNLTKESAGKIARQYYWDKNQCDKLPNGVDLYMFDMSFNMGGGKGAEIIQSAINQAGQVRVVVDGVLGPKTIEAANKTEIYRLLAELDGFRSYTYGTYRQFDRYGYGWQRRAADILVKAVLANSKPENNTVTDKLGAFKNALIQFINGWK